MPPPVDVEHVKPYSLLRAGAIENLSPGFLARMREMNFAPASLPHDLDAGSFKSFSTL